MKKLTLFFASLFIPFGLLAQLDPGPTVAGSRADANYLAEGYLSPLGDALSSSLNNGWYNTAKTKKTLRFELGLHTTIVFVPDEATTFTILDSELQELSLVDPTDNVTPTAFGDDESGVELEYDDPTIPTNIDGQRFRMPSGSGLQVFPLPIPQLGVGLPLNSEISIRYLPQITAPVAEQTDINLFGIAVKHDIKQWIPGLKRVPILSLSAFLGYTSFGFEQGIDDPEFDDQKLIIDSEAFTARLLASAKLAFVTAYGGFGYNSGSSQIQIQGTYPYLDPTNPLDPVTTLTDPVNFTVEGANGFVGNLGVRLKFLFVAYFHADYTFGAFNALTSGLGVSIDF